MFVTVPEVMLSLKLLKIKELEEAYSPANAEVDYQFDVCLSDGLEEDYES